MNTLLSRTIRKASTTYMLRGPAFLSTSAKEPKATKDRRTKKKTSTATEGGEQRLNEQEQAKAAAESATFGKEGARVVPAASYKSHVREMHED
ncbi:hypothetical protein FBU31_003234 [Coemansia sp. 'formosensis']|nr:hypothetical protein FBU31_003234 [Coemansia sp. 'formosensis']